MNRSSDRSGATAGVGTAGGNHRNVGAARRSSRYVPFALSRRAASIEGREARTIRGARMSDAAQDGQRSIAQQGASRL